jgi:tRNA pseudouridine13 synthase
MAEEEHPRKKPRLENDVSDNNLSLLSAPDPTPNEAREVQKELRAGITAFVSPNTPGFSGVLKWRFTDFIVNEILPTGEVLHLNELARAGAKRIQNQHNSEAIEIPPEHLDVKDKTQEKPAQSDAPNPNGSEAKGPNDESVCCHFVRKLNLMLMSTRYRQKTTKTWLPSLGSKKLLPSKN